MGLHIREQVSGSEDWRQCWNKMRHRGICSRGICRSKHLLSGQSMYRLFSAAKDCAVSLWDAATAGVPYGAGNFEKMVSARSLMAVWMGLWCAFVLPPVRFCSVLSYSILYYSILQRLTVRISAGAGAVLYTMYLPSC